MDLKKWAVAGLAAGLTVSSAMAQDDQKKDTGKGKTYLGVRGGFYFPTNSKISDIFDSAIPVFGITVDDITKQADKWRLTFDADFITGSKDGNKFFAAPFTASFGRIFGNRGDTSRPYVKFGVGGAYFDYSITDPSTSERFSTKRFGASADAEVGIIIGERLRIAGKYQWFSKVDDFDFSGFQLTATYQLIKF